MKAHSIDELRERARRRIPKVIFDFMDGEPAMRAG